jgi:hypothetical protein
MVRYIAHRGNVSGPSLNENHPDHIDNAIASGFDVEIDVWIDGYEIFLGHDEPQYEIADQFLEKRRHYIWCHAKNIQALKYLLDNKFHVFFHDKDDYTLTSEGYIWAYPGTELVKGAICVMPENADDPEYLAKNIHLIHGVCSDYVQIHKNKFA